MFLYVFGLSHAFFFILNDVANDSEENEDDFESNECGSLQAQPVSPELVSKMLGNRVAVSPIVTVEPRRRKFHKPITLTIPLPKASQKGMLNQYGSEAPTLRLLCSLAGKRKFPFGLAF